MQRIVDEYALRIEMQGKLRIVFFRRSENGGPFEFDMT